MKFGKTQFSENPQGGGWNKEGDFQAQKKAPNTERACRRQVKKAGSDATGRGQEKKGSLGRGMIRGNSRFYHCNGSRLAWKEERR